MFHIHYLEYQNCLYAQNQNSSLNCTHQYKFSSSLSVRYRCFICIFTPLTFLQFWFLSNCQLSFERLINWCIISLLLPWAPPLPPMCYDSICHEQHAIPSRVVTGPDIEGQKLTSLPFLFSKRFLGTWLYYSLVPSINCLDCRFFGRIRNIGLLGRYLQVSNAHFVISTSMYTCYSPTWTVDQCPLSTDVTFLYTYMTTPHIEQPWTTYLRPKQYFCSSPYLTPPS